MKIINAYSLLIGAVVLPFTDANPTSRETVWAYNKWEAIPRAIPTWDHFWEVLDAYKNCMRIEKNNRYGPTLRQWFDDCNEICVAQIGGRAQDVSDWYIQTYGHRWKGIG
ncbi:hypothetical protein M434DRAFT_17045 [Hypoxylon sp. CO27-5]|nr:hypothetical protein M434DRAFT_17045 [Hypoxylon sp. CO27-5]